MLSSCILLTSYFQTPICSPAENECYQKLRHNTFDCKAACTGLFADVNVEKWKPTLTNDLDGFGIENNEERIKFAQLLIQYRKYKTDFVENIQFELENIYSAFLTLNFSKFCDVMCHSILHITMIVMM